MKKSLLILCLILAFPIIFSGPRMPSSPVQVYAQCIDNSYPGNSCENVERKHMPRPTKSGDRNHQFTPTDTLGSGLAALASVLMIWMGLRL